MSHRSTRSRRSLTATAALSLAVGLLPAGGSQATAASGADTVPIASGTATGVTGPAESGSADKLGDHDRQLLAQATSRKQAKVTVLIATDRGRTAAVAAQVQGMEGTIANRVDAVAAKSKDLGVTPAALRQAIYSSAEFEADIPAYAQGNGCFSVPGAWNLLKTTLQTRTYTSSAPVCTPLSGVPRDPRLGPGHRQPLSRGGRWSAGRPEEGVRRDPHPHERRERSGGPPDHLGRERRHLHLPQVGQPPAQHPGDRHRRRQAGRGSP